LNPEHGYDVGSLVLPWIDEFCAFTPCRVVGIDGGVYTVEVIETKWGVV
jgi:hypothetical protein